MIRLTIILSLITLNSFAQNTENQTGNWLMYFGQNHNQILKKMFN